MSIKFLRLASPQAWLTRRVALAVAVAALADWLSFNNERLGLSLVVLFAACGGVAIVANPVRARVKIGVFASAVLVLGLAALAENVSPLSFSMGALATLLFALAMVSGRFNPWHRQLAFAGLLPICGPFWFIDDIVRVREFSGKKPTATFTMAWMTAWIAPIVLSLAFLYLFADANPIIETWLRQIDPRILLQWLSPMRALFWLIAICLAWPFVHLRLQRLRGTMRAPSAQTPREDPFRLLFGPAAVLRSLVLFNVLFAVQTSFDLAYLWGGVALPNGYTLAGYAHRGAYPLIATALLAAAFVLIAMRPGGPANSSRWIKPLIAVWIAQNFLLVLFSIDRTLLYVSAYMLTELRLAALIWMGLVAVGLVCILVQILAGKSNIWLLNTQALACAATLYACCFVNFPYVVASYNVAHCFEATGTGLALDIGYLLRLGPQAIPAYDSLLQNQADGSNRRFDLFAARIDEQSKLQENSERNWRGWSFREWRRTRYIAMHPINAAVSGDGR